MREMEGSGDESERNGGNGFVSASAQSEGCVFVVSVSAVGGVCLQRQKKDEVIISSLVMDHI